MQVDFIEHQIYFAPQKHARVLIACGESKTSI